MGVHQALKQNHKDEQSLESYIEQFNLRAPTQPNRPRINLWTSDVKRLEYVRIGHQKQNKNASFKRLSANHLQG
ncbi:hypothetical protein A3A21_03055 [Candidatus Jorgensenbacteria bacterium RIFCSPLOWO2_01_FULL_45_25b]|uniref:Uncharacterized protein n=1 Tax=Candidatus Jorgensenbacteria bacterium RIFCSPLOWO2_01_FULL_45_25b TaxID=1798471 RepID=A0A1F6BUM0_9BACT|nr:MAG: hypothetical protein A3A21_03055 [Candidatus Jorgensenbacteria bacterium RIFCSPLOWO2_01_FULL_45_25b]